MLAFIRVRAFLWACHAAHSVMTEASDVACHVLPADFPATRKRAVQAIVIVIRETGLLPVPWRNGGGVTREIYRTPLDTPAFDWRLSLATIDRPGPFSIFEHYERTLVLARGAGIELNFGPHGKARLARLGQLVAFDGGCATVCTLLDGPSTDLNLIVSNARAKSQSRVVQVLAIELIPTANWLETFVCCLSGSVQIRNAADDMAELAPVDVARCGPADGVITCRLRSATPAQLFIAAVTRQERRG